MKLKTPEKYNSILAVVQFKDFFKDVDTSLKNKDVLREKGLNISTVTTPAIQSLRVKEGAPPAKVSLTPLIIEYREMGIGSEDTSGIFDIVHSLYEERKKMVPENEWDNIDFTGAIIQALYDLEEDDLEKIEDKFSRQVELGHKRIDLKLNYQDEERWNYNVTFMFNLEKDELMVNFDINDRYLENQSVENLRIILEKIDSHLKDAKNLSRLLW